MVAAKWILWGDWGHWQWGSKLHWTQNPNNRTNSYNPTFTWPIITTLFLLQIIAIMNKMCFPAYEVCCQNFLHHPRSNSSCETRFCQNIKKNYIVFLVNRHVFSSWQTKQMGLFEFRTYAVLSFVITALVTYQQAALYQQFFPTMVKMFTQRLSRLIMFNNGIVFIMMFGKLLAWIFLGKLRPLETEVLQYLSN